MKNSPFLKTPSTAGRTSYWVKPKLVCEVAFTAWTEGGMMRHPVVLGLRPDKMPEDVVREYATPAAPSDTSEHGAHAKRTHVEKVYWPEAGYTKGDLLTYYEQAAPVLLPCLKDRPLSLHRFPNGVEGADFYQKNVQDTWPEDLPTVAITTGSGKASRYALCQDLDTLLYLANLGCIELHPWSCRQQHLEYPDYLIIDLDPEALPFGAVVDVARSCKQLFDELKLTAYLKTSGQRGLHLALPMGARYHQDDVLQLAQILAAFIHQRLPKVTSLEHAPKMRQKRVYLDIMRNARAQTSIAAYCPRPAPTAPVSMPLAWSELNKRLDPTKFDLKSAPRQFTKRAELWPAHFAEHVVNMPRVLEELSSMAGFVHTAKRTSAKR